MRKSFNVGTPDFVTKTENLQADVVEPQISDVLGHMSRGQIEREIKIEITRIGCPKIYNSHAGFRNNSAVQLFMIDVECLFLNLN